MVIRRGEAVGIMSSKLRKDGGAVLLGVQDACLAAGRIGGFPRGVGQELVTILFFSFYRFKYPSICFYKITKLFINMTLTHLKYERKYVQIFLN